MKCLINDTVMHEESVIQLIVTCYCSDICHNFHSQLFLCYQYARILGCNITEVFLFRRPGSRVHRHEVIHNWETLLRDFTICLKFCKHETMKEDELCLLTNIITSNQKIPAIGATIVHQ